MAYPECGPVCKKKSHSWDLKHPSEAQFWGFSTFFTGTHNLVGLKGTKIYKSVLAHSYW